MVTAKRGRPAQLPEDATELDADRVDVAARIAWLLRVSRLSASDSAVRSLAGFVTRMGRVGCGTDPGRVSQWETGTLAVTTAVISAYELVLQLPPGRLRGVCETIRRTLPSIDGVTRISSAPLADPQSALDCVYDEVVRGEPAGGDWLTLSDLLTGRTPVLIPTAEFERLALRLMLDMMRSVGAGFAARFDALGRLVDDPRLTVPVLRAAHEVLQEPGAQAVVEPLSLFGEVTPSPRIVARMVAMLVDGDNPWVQKGASHALLHMLNRQQMAHESLEVVERAVAGLLLDDPNGSGGAAARPLAVRLPSRQRSSIGSTRLRTGRRPPSAASIPSAAVLGRFVENGMAGTGFPDDAMFVRLVRESLSSQRPDRAHLACITLLVSPYRASVAASVVELIEDRSVPEPVHARLGDLLTYVAGTDQHDTLHRWVTGPQEDLRLIALYSLAHSSGVDAEVDLDDLVRRGGAEATAALYAAGMSGHPALAVWGFSSAAELRSRANWWTRHGKAIQDEPLQLPRPEDTSAGARLRSW